MNAKSMKLLHIAECAAGVERYLQMLLSRLEKRGVWQFFICSKNYNKQSYGNMVAMRIDVIPIFIEDGVDGLLVEVDNPQNAADKVFWLYLHPEETAEMRRKALKIVIENYDINCVVNQYVEMCVNMISRGANLCKKCSFVFIGCAATLESEERRVTA